MLLGLLVCHWLRQWEMHSQLVLAHWQSQWHTIGVVCKPSLGTSPLYRIVLTYHLDRLCE